MKFKLLLLVLSIAFVASVNAQSPFKKRPILAYQPHQNLRLGVAPLDSNVSMWRFSGATGYSYPDGNVQAGIGYGIVHSKYTFATQTYYDEWSVSGYVWAGGNVAPQSVSDVVKISVMAGFLNGAIAFGPYYSIGPKTISTDGKTISQFGAMLTTTLKFNP